MFPRLRFLTFRTRSEGSPRTEQTVGAAPAPPPKQNPRGSARWWWAVAAVLLGFAALSWSASWSKGVSFDEGLQLAVGYKLWRHDDYRVEGANGDLIKRWATLPYLFTSPQFPARGDPEIRQLNSYELGRRFLFELGNRPEVLLRQARAMITLLGVAAGLLVFWFSREIFGPVGGFISLVVYATSPHILAFSAIVSTDMSITLTLFGSTLCIWQLLHRISLGRLLVSLLLFSALVLAKMSAAVIFPIAVLLVALRFLVGRPWLISWRGARRPVSSRQAQAWLVAGLILVHAFAGWSAIWAHYGFRFAASPVTAESPQVLARPNYLDKEPGPFAPWVRWAREKRFLPEGFCAGVEWLLGSDDKQVAFMRGKAKLGGWSSFFPYAIWAKTQPALFFLLIVGWGSWLWRDRRNPRSEDGGADVSRATLLYAIAPHLVLLTVYLGVAMTEDINIGHRHVLPLYPSLYVLVGVIGLAMPREAGRWGLVVSLLLLWRVGEVLALRPHYLAYFGPQVGGPRVGYRHLIDSSLDWGMDLPGLRQWLVRHNPERRERVFLAYFGTDSPRHYGLELTRLPGFHPPRERQAYGLTPGIYAISATLLQGAYVPTLGPWNPVYETVYQAKLRSVRRLEEATDNPARRAELLREEKVDYWEREYRTYDYFRFGRLCAWLRSRGQPADHVGHSILIWRLSYADLDAALNGPPPELGEPLGDWLHYLGFRPDRVTESFQIDVSGDAHAPERP